MKSVILSADGDRYVYSVPNEVADNLTEYCIEFCDNWLINSPHAKKFRNGRLLCYDQEAFIWYLNKFIFPNQPSKYIDNIGFTYRENDIPDKYKNCPSFNF